MKVQENRNYSYLYDALKEHWGLGMNIALSWAPFEEGIAVLIIPHYFITTSYVDQRDTSKHPKGSDTGTRNSYGRSSKELLKELNL